MGNYASCALAAGISSNTNNSSSSSATTKVIFPGGEIHSFKSPISAAELMLESPNSFLVTSQSLSLGRRLSPLPADSILNTGSFYILLPMNRLNSSVTTADMGAVYLAVNGGNKNNKKKKKWRLRGGGGGGSSSSGAKVRVVPEVMEMKMETEVKLLNLDDIEGLDEFKHRMSVSRRSKKPVLETIVEEEPVSMR